MLRYPLNSCKLRPSFFFFFFPLLTTRPISWTCGFSDSPCLLSSSSSSSPKVAKKVLRHFPTLSLLRRHPAPVKAQFGPLVSAAAAAGFDVRTADSRALADSLDQAVRSDDP